MPFTPTPTIGDDILTDTAGDDTVDALAGNDTITVTRGFDTVNGNTGRDRLIIDYSGATQSVGGFGFTGSLASGYEGRIWQGNLAFAVDFTGIEDFTVTGSNSNDTITFGDGDDVANLGAGDDFVLFGSGNDSGDGGTGTDGFSANLSGVSTAVSLNLVTGAGNIFRNFEYVGTLTTGSGNDIITTRAENRAETINTGDGDDVVTVAGGTDTVDLGAGNDLLMMTGGINTIAGGLGVDRLVVDLRGNGFALNNQPGVPLTTDPAGGFQGAYTNGQNASVNFTGIENITIITDNNSSDNITTGDGEDEYSQRALDSSTYIRDTANLGGGIDLLSVDARGTNGALSNTLAQTYNGSGEVTLYGNGKLGYSNVERFFLQGGNAGDDLRGFDYADRFDGNGGNDRLAGRGGNDDLRGGAGADVIDGDGRVTILLAADNQNNAGTGVSDNDFRVTGLYNLANPAEFDLAVGTENAGIAQLRIRATDVENASAGFDPEVDEVYVNDVLIGTLAQFADNSTGDTILTFDAALLSSGVARIRIQNVNLTQDYSFRIDDVELTLEKTGNDRLDGGGGVDQLVGGRGDDVYIVDEDRDQAQEQAGQGTDTALSQGRMFTLGANVENLGSTLAATPVALAVEAQINTDIVAATQHPRGVTVLNDGGYVVTWQDVNNGNDARARVFNADGSARSAEFTVNASTAGNQSQFGLASVALADGGFLVAYYDTTTGPNGERIAGRVFDANGVAQGADYTLTDTIGTFDSFPAMARLNDGRIALISQNGGSQDGNGTFGIRYTLLNADGSVGAGAPTILQTTTAGDQLGPSVAKLDDGRLIVVWESGEPGGKVFRGRIIEADGTPSGNDFLISAPGGESPDSGEVRAQVTAISGGGFAVVWGITNEIVGRVFDSTGAPLAEQFTINQRTDGAQTTVAITRLAEGGFMAAWTSDNGQDGDAHGIVARLFNGDGSARGDDFVVNQIGTRFQLFPELATLQDGRIIVVFSSDVPGSGSNYEAKQIILDTTPDQTLVGNELANTITAGSSDDVLAGSGGGDTLNGGAGDDVIFGGGFVGSGTNLIVNGSFETQDGMNVTRDFILATPDGISEGIAFRGVTSLFGWTRGNTSAPIELETNSGSTLFATGDGTSAINLEYAGNQQQSLSQDIAGLIAGEKYLLRFSANQLASATDFTESMQVAWNGVVVTTIMADTRTPGFYTVVLEAAATGTGAGGSNRLEFREISSGDGGGTTLDAISLEALVAAPDMAIGALGPNLIANGSFEQRDATTTSRDYALANAITDFNGGDPLYALSNQLFGWGLLPGNTRVEFNTDNPNNPANVFQTGDGLVALDMEVFPGEQTGIFQDVNGLAAGERYRITVSVANPAGPIDGAAALQVIWNGRVVGTVSPTSLTPTDYSFDVIAQGNGAGAGGANRIAFQEVGGNDGRGTILDHVRLNLVTAATADDDSLQGGAGNDILHGSGGTDMLDGGTGDDRMAGGAGDDIYFVDSDLDVVVEAVDSGIDEVWSSVRKTSAAANVENLTYTGTGDFTGRGNGLGNVITGGANSDLLFGKGGDDTLNGGTGNDILDGGTGADIVNAGDGNDVIYAGDGNDSIDGGAGTDTVIFYSPGIVFAGSSNGVEIFENLSGGDLAADLNAGDNIFGGSTGTDSINGMAGNDLLYGREGNDLFSGGDGSDRLFGMADDDVLNGGNDNDYLYGDTGNDVVAGNSGDDVLYGEDGDDDLTGGSGIDLLGGGIGADDFIFAGGDSGSTFETADRIIDFSSAQGDRIDLSAIDAIAGGGDDAFSFTGDTAFGNVAGQLRAEVVGGSTYVMGDVDGDGIADFVIKLDGSVPLSGSDFLL